MWCARSISINCGRIRSIKRARQGVVGVCKIISHNPYEKAQVQVLAADLECSHTSLLNSCVAQLPSDHLETPETVYAGITNNGQEEERVSEKL